jgi:quercetin dioxygenase-like cupin family protein
MNRLVERTSYVRPKLLAQTMPKSAQTQPKLYKEKVERKFSLLILVAAVTLLSSNQGFQFFILSFEFKKGGSNKWFLFMLLSIMACL